MSRSRHSSLEGRYPSRPTWANWPSTGSRSSRRCARRGSKISTSSGWSSRLSSRNQAGFDAVDHEARRPSAARWSSVRLFYVPGFNGSTISEAAAGISDDPRPADAPDLADSEEHASALIKGDGRPDGFPPRERLLRGRERFFAHDVLQT